MRTRGTCVRTPRLLRLGPKGQDGADLGATFERVRADIWAAPVVPRPARNVLWLLTSMRFNKKIGLSFLLLSFFTVATGGIGLLFIYRVLGAFATVPGIEGPAAGGLADLNRSMQQAVDISQAVSGNNEIEDVLQLRKEFAATVQEFDRSFSRIRRDLEDDLTLDRLEQVKAEQAQLAEQTHTLLDAMLEELRAENTYRQSLADSERQWQVLVGVLRGATDSLTDGGAETADDLARPEVSIQARLRSFVRIQQLLIETRFRLKEYLALEESARLAPAREELDRRVAELSASVEALGAAAAPGATSDVPMRAVPAVRSWLDGLVGSDGLLGRYRRAVELQNRTDLLAGQIRQEGAESLRALDSVVSLGARLSAKADSRSFVTMAPTLLIIVVALTTVLSIVLAAVLTHAITRPVRQLIGVAEAVGRGDYSPRLRATSGDELSALGEAFNRMVQEVDRSQEQIRALNLGLEKKVQERTAELRQEISRRQGVEESLRGSEARYRTLIENFPGGIIALVDQEDRVVALGGQSLARLGPVPDHRAERALDEIFPPAYLETLRGKISEGFAGARQEFDLKSGGLEWRVSVVPTPRTGTTDRDTVTVLALDVTEARRVEQEMKRRQQQLMQAEKLASLGVLVAGVAHEINNPNQAVMMAGELLRRAWPDIRTILDGHRSRETGFLIGGIDYEELRDTLDEQFRGILESARRVDSIVQELREFARHGPEDMSQPVNLTLVVRSALILLASTIRKATDSLTVDLLPEIPTFRGNPQRIEQVVINLVQNACQAIADRRGGIAISTSVSQDACRVVLQIRDEGVGIPPEDMSRIRDPFFTTKREQGGTGLGLSITSAIVTEHAGELEFSSGLGAGTTVRASFPLAGSPGGGFA